MAADFIRCAGPDHHAVTNNSGHWPNLRMATGDIGPIRQNLHAHTRSSWHAARDLCIAVNTGLDLHAASGGIGHAGTAPHTAAGDTGHAGNSHALGGGTCNSVWSLLHFDSLEGGAGCEPCPREGIPAKFNFCFRIFAVWNIKTEVKKL
jgi:hypothetical protein